MVFLILVASIIFKNSVDLFTYVYSGPLPNLKIAFK